MSDVYLNGRSSPQNTLSESGRTRNIHFRKFSKYHDGMSDIGFHRMKLCYVRPWNGWDVSDRMIPCMVSPWSAAPPNHAVRPWSEMEARLTEILRRTSSPCFYDAGLISRQYELSISRTGPISWLQNVSWTVFIEHRWQKYMTHHCIMTYLQRGLNKEACIGTGALLLSQKVLDLKLTLVMQDQLDTKYKS